MLLLSTKRKRPFHICRVYSALLMSVGLLRLLSGEVRSGMLTAVDELIALVREDNAADSVQNLVDARTTLEVLLAITESAAQEGKRIAIEEPSS